MPSSNGPRRPSPGGRRPSDRTAGSGETFFIEPDGSNREAVRRIGYRFVDLLVEAAAEAGRRSPLDRDLGKEPGPYTPPREGRGLESLWPEIERLLRHGMNPGHPGYLGHMDSLASTVGIFSDALVSAMNNNMLAFEMSTFFTELELRLTRWACSLFGLDRGARVAAQGPIGHLVSGGTLANITALWTARNGRAGGGRFARERLAGISRPPVFLASEDAHFSFHKAANLLGLGREGWIKIPTDAQGRAKVEAAREAIARARRDGLDPFCLVGVAGTTVTGTLDPLEELADLAEAEGLWYHVDAAYGGAIALSPKLRPKLRGCERADSITFNPQKWLFVPKTCAAVLFRDRVEVERNLREPFLYGTSNRSSSDQPRPNLGEWTLQGTRRVDALKLYLTLEHLGLERLTGIIERNCELARRFAGAIRACPELELLQEPDLSIVCFRYRGVPHWPEWVAGHSPVDRLNARIQERIEANGHAWMSLPRYRERSCLRAVILHPRCDEALLDRLLEEVRQVGGELATARG